MIDSIDYPQLQHLLQEDSRVVLIDVRTPAEHTEYNIGGINIPMDDWTDILDRYDTGQAMVLYCAKGIRSMIVLQKLALRGYRQLYNLQYGISAL